MTARRFVADRRTLYQTSSKRRNRNESRNRTSARASRGPNFGIPPALQLDAHLATRHSAGRRNAATPLSIVSSADLYQRLYLDRGGAAVALEIVRWRIQRFQAHPSLHRVEADFIAIVKRDAGVDLRRCARLGRCDAHFVPVLRHAGGEPRQQRAALAGRVCGK